MRVGERRRRARAATTAFAAAAALAASTALAACGTAAVDAEADGGPNHRGVTGWIPYWNGDGADSFAENIDLFEEISPFWYMAQGGPGDFVVHGGASALAGITADAAARGVPVIPTLTDGNGKGVMAGYLADPALRSQHADAIVALVTANGFDGIDLDYETFAFTDGRASWPALQPNWVAFVQELGAKLHAQGRRLVVTVPPIWLTSAGEQHSGSYWVYDWVDIAGSVDRLRAMTYDWSVGSAGPISPHSFVQGTLAYAQSIGFDMSKLQIGIPLYGRNWVTEIDGTCPANAVLATASVTNANVDGLIATWGAQPVRDAASGELHFSYQVSYTGTPTPPPAPADPGQPAPALGGIGAATATAGATRLGACTVTRTVWYLDSEAIADRAALAVEAGAGVAVWALGFDASWTWDALRSRLAVQR